MIVYANAKLNLGLQITGKRSDGYHLLESLFIPIPLSDVLEISVSKDSSNDDLQILGDVETGLLADNLVLRAVQRLRDLHDIPPLKISLLKQIPSGAGMGGGSSDATHTLKAIRDLCHLDISDAELERIALSLGADCPFFVVNKPRLVSGIGEIFSPAPPLDLSPYFLVVVKPDLHISTKEAFGGLTHIGGHSLSVLDALSKPIDSWKDHLRNDFEDSLFPSYPELGRLKSLLYALGAVYASMTGSGAAIYGFFRSPLTPAEISQLGDIFFWQGRLV